MSNSKINNNEYSTILLAAIQKKRGVPEGSWHEQKLILQSLQEEGGRIYISFSFHEDLDVFAQYDKSVSWSGNVILEEEISGNWRVQGSCQVQEAGVLSGVDQKSTFTLG